MYSIKVDWVEEFKANPDKWTNNGRDVLEQSCDHHDKDPDNTNVSYSGYCEKCEISESDCDPMMNFAYPLFRLPNEEQILKVVKETCLTIMTNNDTDESFLVLCGGGMDLSQSIALAYVLSGEPVPDALASAVITQPFISTYGKNYFKVMRECKASLKSAISSYKDKVKRINEDVKKARADLKAKNDEVKKCQSK